MSELPDWHPGIDFAEGANDWQKEPDLCRALELASQEHYYAGYCGYDKLMLAAKAGIERERERCAKVAQEYMERCDLESPGAVADAIRAAPKHS